MNLALIRKNDAGLYKRRKDMEDLHFLTSEERLEIKNLLMDFLRKENKTPAEVAILPEIIKFLISSY